jgi:hypothetical protein
LLFHLEDVRGARVRAAAPAPPASPFPAAPPADAAFEAAFDEAFTRLDREGGSYNFVSLADLRRALPLERAAFDAHLRRLRAARRYALSPDDGRQGLTEGQRAAAVMEDGIPLLYVSRR